MTVLLYRLLSEAEEPLAGSERLVSEILANVPTKKQVETIVDHVRNFVPDFRGLRVDKPGWINELRGERPLNYTYGFGLLAESVRTTLILEGLGIDFLGAPAVGLYLGSNKPHAANLVSSLGFCSPRQLVICRPPEAEAIDRIQRHFEGCSLLVLRPAYEESSVGLSLVVNDPDSIKTATHSLFEQLPETMLIQEYIDGLDVTVPIIGRSHAACLPAVILSPKNRPEGAILFDAALKADETGIDYWTLKNYPETLRTEIYALASAAYFVTKQRDSARVDLRLSRQGRPYFLEINSNPVLDPVETPFSLAQSAREIGMEVGQIVDLIIKDKPPAYGASPVAVDL